MKTLSQYLKIMVGGKLPSLLIKYNVSCTLF